MEIPGYGLVEGPWDLRGGVDDYLGNVDLNGKRVLEVGTASGFLCFTMEGRGADVVAYDLSDEQSWDVVPYAQYDRVVRHRAPRASPQAEQQLVARPRRVRVLGQGRLRDGLRDPGRDRTRRGRDVRERAPALPRPVSRPRARPAADDRDRDRHREPLAALLASADGGEPAQAEHGVSAELPARPAARVVVALTPAAIKQMLGILGFEDTTVRYHVQRFEGRRNPQFTVVGRRTRPLPD